MTEKHLDTFLLLCTRTGMAVHPMTKYSVVNFVHGYEAGTEDACDYTKLVKEFLSTKYKIPYSSDGWPGQINRLAERNNETWLFTFKKVTFEIVLNLGEGSFPESYINTIRKQVNNMVTQIEMPLPQYWVERWNEIMNLYLLFANHLWLEKERILIGEICITIERNTLANNNKEPVDMAHLVNLRQKFLEHTSKHT